MIKAESEAEVNRIEMQKQIDQKEAAKQIDDIENKMYLEREKARADAEFYKISKEIEANQLKLTPEYLQKIQIESITHNTKFYFGESIPKFFTENMGQIAKTQEQP